MAFTFLGVAVVAATGTADAPVGSPQALPEPARPSLTGPSMPSATPVATTAPASTTEPSRSVGGPFTDAPVSVRPAAVATALPDERARTAVRVAMTQIGLPYVWGGDGPEAGDRGFDCSGLTHFAYDEAGVDLPRTAHTQFRAGPRVPDGAPLHPGDLVFYGTYRKVHHVGMYLGGGRMVNAPTFGKPVRTAWYRWRGDDYIGASRPASSTRGSAPLADVPPVPDPTVPSPDDFVAPAAPRPPVVPEPRAPQPPEPDSATQSRTGSDADIAAGRVPAPPSALVVPQVPTTGNDARPSTGPPAASGTAAGAPSPGSEPGPSVPSGIAAGAPTTSGAATGPAVPQPSASAGGGTPQMTPPTTTASPAPSSASSTSAPATSAPATSAPTTSASPSPSPSSAAIGPQPAAPSPPSRSGPAPTSAMLTVGEDRLPIRLLDIGPDGFPTVPGAARGPRGWVARLGEPLAAGAGTPVALTLPDGRTVRWTVTSRSEPGPRDAVTSPPDAPLVLLVPTDDGLWTVVTAG